MGTIYKRGQTYWIKYYHDGRPIYESSRSKLKMFARELLKQREGDIAQGKIPGVYFDKITFDELAEDLITDYHINKKKDMAGAEIRIRHLKSHFGGWRVHKINSLEIKAYIKKRKKEGKANATISLELDYLKRMLNLGASLTPPKVDRVPHFPKIEISNVRTGFFEHDDFLRFRDELPDYLKGFTTFAYYTGWRMSEVIGLTWSRVDRLRGIVRLEPGETKNDKGRTIYLGDELKAVINEQRKRKMQSKGFSDYVFPNRNGTGKITGFRDPWNRACRKAGLGYGYKINDKYAEKWEKELPKGPTFHDFRRTAIRNMVRSGIPDRVAMKVSGHETRSVFDRYNIVNDTDLKEAALRQEKYLTG